MKLSYLFVLSTAAVVPTGAIGADPQVDLRTNLGTIRLELYPAKAPKTVENFLQYVKAGHYNGTIFHRVIDGFMIQGGGFDRAYKQKPTRPPVPIESKNGLKNDLGWVAMARTNDPNSATAQFFININDNDFLNWGNPRSDGNGYAVFGKVVSGLEVVNKIAKAPKGAKAMPPGSALNPGDVPTELVVIKAARIVEPAKP